LEGYLRAEAERALLEEDYSPGVYWPSEVWRCLRASYLRRVDKRPPTQQTIGYTTLGNILHTWVAQTLQAAGGDSESVEKAARGHHWTSEVESEVNVRIPVEYVSNAGREHLVLSGRMDNVIVIKQHPAETGKEGGGEVRGATQTLIVEVKTVAGYRAPQNSEADELPFKEHRAQLNCYLKAYPYAQGIILYISRRDLEMREYHVHYDETLWLETENRLRALHEHVKRGVIPPPEAKTDPRRHWECANCAYHNICYPSSTNTSAGIRDTEAAGSMAPTTHPASRSVKPQPTTHPAAAPHTYTARSEAVARG